MLERSRVGAVSCPSGILVVVDLGYLWLWSGSSIPEPHLTGTEDAATRATIESMRDYRIGGPDAEQVGKIANLAAISCGRFIYDIPDQGRETILSKIASVAAANGLHARVEQEPTRIPHRVRAQRAADIGGADFVMEGPWVVAVGGIPRRPLPVTAERQDFGGHVGDRWSEVTVEVDQGERELTQLVGYFGVDYGMAVLADADAAGHKNLEDELRAQIGSRRYGTGSAKVGDALLLGMDTSWGDGLFPVYADRGAGGKLLSVRLVLGDENRRQLAEKVWERAQRHSG